MNSSSLQEQVQQVNDLVQAIRRPQGRSVVAIAGPPASGKSTLAEALVETLCHQQESAVPGAAVLPMDGYHLDNSILQSRGLLARKGAPETFDANGFCAAVKHLLTDEGELFFPSFDRQLDLAIANAIVIHPETPVVVVEGNYLLLDALPWRGLREVFSVTVFLNPGIDVLRQRLVQRWLDHGLEPEAATIRAEGNDLPNASVVINNSCPADLMLS